MKSTLIVSYVLLSLSVALPAGYIATGANMSTILGEIDPDIAKTAWVYSPAFAINDIDGAQHPYAAAFRIENRGDIASLCKWMPHIRDSIQTALSEFRREYYIDGRPDTRRLLKRLRPVFKSILARYKPQSIKIVPAAETPVKPIDADAVVVCYNDRVYEAGRRGPNTGAEYKIRTDTP